MRRSRMPVRSRIHSSEVSTILARSALLSTRSGTYMPVPTTAAPRMVSGGSDMVRLDLFADVLVDAVLHEAREREDRTAEGARLAAPVPNETHTVDPEQRRGAVLLPVDLGLEALQGRQHQQRAEAREQVALELVADFV